MNLELLEEFLDNFTSVYTRISYSNDLKQFFSFLSQCHPELLLIKDIERKHVIKFRNWLSEIGGRQGEAAAPKTISRKMAAVSSYFDHLVEMNHCEFNPATSIKRPRKAVLTPTAIITGDELQLILTEIEGKRLNRKDTPQNCAYMHKALILTFFMTGLRKSEVLNLRRKDFEQIGPHTVLRFKGKGGKSGQKLLHPLAIEAIEDYLNWASRHERSHHPQDWLFRPTVNPTHPNELNRPLNPKTINEILESYAKKVGITTHITPHGARATFITQLLAQGVDIYRVAQEVNHSSVKTTQEYDKRRKKINESPIYELNYDLQSNQSPASFDSSKKCA